MISSASWLAADAAHGCRLSYPPISRNDDTDHVRGVTAIFCNRRNRPGPSPPFSPRSSMIAGERRDPRRSEQRAETDSSADGATSRRPAKLSRPGKWARPPSSAGMGPCQFFSPDLAGKAVAARCCKMAYEKAPSARAGPWSTHSSAPRRPFDHPRWPCPALSVATHKAFCSQVVH